MTYAKTAAVSYKHCHVISGSGCAWLGECPTIPHGPDVDQMWTRSSSAVFQAAVEQVQPGCWRIQNSLWFGPGKNVTSARSCTSILAPLHSSKKIAVFPLQCVDYNLLIIFYPSQVRLCSTFMLDEYMESMSRAFLSTKRSVHSEKNDGVGSSNTNIGGNNLCFPACIYSSSCWPVCKHTNKQKNQ